MDTAINELLKACGTHYGANVHLDYFMPIIFLVGDSKIGHGTWSSYETYLVDRLRCLGHTVILRWEHNTSQMCPRKECNHSRMEDQGVGIRVKYCRSCHIFYHRDVVAAQNNVVIFLFELEHGYRPFQYCTLKQQSEWGIQHFIINIRSIKD